MRTYVIVTGIAFALLALAHLFRLAVEGTGPISDPVFTITTIGAVAISIWAAVLLLRKART